MLRSKVLHKHKKVCFVLMIAMERDYGIKPGTLLRSKKTDFLMLLKGNVDEDKIVTTAPERGYLSGVSLPDKTVLMFIDVVYDPYIKAHFLRFLQKNTIVGIRFEKGKTLAKLMQTYDKLDPDKELENA